MYTYVHASVKFVLGMYLVILEELVWYALCMYTLLHGELFLGKQVCLF